MHAETHDQTPPTVSADLERMFRDHQSQVFGTAYRVTGSAQDAEDVLQTVFLRLLRRQRVDLSPSPSSYLYRAAVNASLDLLRSRTRAGALPLDELRPPVDELSNPERHQRDREIRRCLRQALLSLTPASAELFTLRFLQGFGNREIAAMTNKTQTAVGVMLHRARGRVKKEIGSCVGGIDP